MSTLPETLPASTRGDNSKSEAKRLLPRELRLFCNVTLWASVAAWLLAFVAGRVGLKYPYNWPMISADALHDYWNYFDRFNLLHTSEFFAPSANSFTYLAPAVVLYKFLYAFGKSGGFLVYMILIVVALSLAFVRIRSEMLLRGFPTSWRKAFRSFSLSPPIPLFFVFSVAISRS